MFNPISKHLTKKTEDDGKLSSIDIISVGEFEHVREERAKGTGTNMTVISRSLVKADTVKEMIFIILAHNNKVVSKGAAR